MLFWVYSKSIGAAEKVGLFLFYTGYAYIMFNGNDFLTPDMWNLVGKSNLALLVLSRVPQIITNFMNKSTGQLAFFTFLLTFLGGVARLGTVLIETDDFSYQLSFIVGVVLSGIIVLQFLLYWNTPAKAVAPE